jgi:hypothetical protein
VRASIGAHKPGPLATGAHKNRKVNKFRGLSAKLFKQLAGVSF